MLSGRFCFGVLANVAVRHRFLVGHLIALQKGMRETQPRMLAARSDRLQYLRKLTLHFARNQTDMFAMFYPPESAGKKV
ncbi:hypothetical protein V4C53_21475 [Paraburkholderia azotifigens]|uniref:hypothetical protein n=1 Tax=Paraburkholderia azotifigens TaxID=2057004 RepID=UPI003177CF2B